MSHNRPVKGTGLGLNIVKVILENHSFDFGVESLGLEESGLNRLIKKSYALLGLISYLTAGEKETRAWTCGFFRGEEIFKPFQKSILERGFFVRSAARNVSYPVLTLIYSLDIG